MHILLNNPDSSISPLLDVRITHCKIFWNIETSTIVLASSATSLLFLLRVRAVYEKSIPITTLFGILWVAIPVSCALVGIAAEPFVSHTFGWGVNPIPLTWLSL